MKCYLKIEGSACVSTWRRESPGPEWAEVEGPEDGEMFMKMKGRLFIFNRLKETSRPIKRIRDLEANIQGDNNGTETTVGTTTRGTSDSGGPVEGRTPETDTTEPEGV